VTASSDGSIRIFVDADACPVKDEIYRVSGRYGLHVFIVANSVMMVPSSPMIERIVVEAGADVADDWIAEKAGPGDIVVTADIPLAARCVPKGAEVISPKGKVFDADSIGMTLAVRDLMDDLRSTGTVNTYNPAFSRNDRSLFLSALDNAVVRVRRAQVMARMKRMPPPGF